MNDSQALTAEHWQDVIQQQFGFSSLREGQADVITRLLAGHSAVAIFPTGGGKSLCYQAAALMLPGLTLVVSPLLALMKDQIDSLVRRDIPAARLDSTLSADQYRTVCDQVRSGQMKMLYVAPERFNNDRFRRLLAGLDISLLAIDEAHCISQWGHNFRPDYLKLSDQIRQFNVSRVLALTATASPQVAAEICQRLNIKEDNVVRTPFFRPNLALQTTPVADADQRSQLLLDRFQQRPPGAAIVYVTLQKTAEEVANQLRNAGHDAKAYHAGMKDEDRESVQQWFMVSPNRIVVATIAFGMGIDKSDIRYVYHYNPPKSLESYSQEIGRAGRDGADSVCELFYLPGDRRVLENFAYGDTPTKQSLAKLFELLFQTNDRLEVSYYQLSAELDIRTLVLRTLLVYLELDGFIQSHTPVYTSNRFKAKRSSREILQHFSGERHQFLTAVLSSAKKGRTWLTIDLEETAQKVNSDRTRVASALGYLADQGWIELEASGVKVPLQILRRPDSLDQLVESMWQRILKREKDEIARMDQVESLITSAGCQAQMLSNHFGEQMEQLCGVCSFCQTGQAQTLPEANEPTIDDAKWKQIRTVQAENRAQLGTARELARFLVGVTSPATTRRKLTSHPLFGALADVPFATIMRLAEQPQR
ncbi:MAG: ATP-dependent DNA helicase RecQ [Pirellulaceae bacterium]